MHTRAHYRKGEYVERPRWLTTDTYTQTSVQHTGRQQRGKRTEHTLGLGSLVCSSGDWAEAPDTGHRRLACRQSCHSSGRGEGPWVADPWGAAHGTHQACRQGGRGREDQRHSHCLAAAWGACCSQLPAAAGALEQTAAWWVGPRAVRMVTPTSDSHARRRAAGAT